MAEKVQLVFCGLGMGRHRGSLVSSLWCLFRLVNLNMKDLSAELTVSVTAFLVEDLRLCEGFEMGFDVVNIIGGCLSSRGQGLGGVFKSCDP